MLVILLEYSIWRHLFSRLCRTVDQKTATKLDLNVWIGFGTFPFRFDSEQTWCLNACGGQKDICTMYVYNEEQKQEKWSARTMGLGFKAEATAKPGNHNIQIDRGWRVQGVIKSNQES